MLRLGVDLLHVMYIEYKQMLVFNYIFDVFCNGRGSSVFSVDFYCSFR